jgi:hypothetical protein
MVETKMTDENELSDIPGWVIIGIIIIASIALVVVSETIKSDQTIIDNIGKELCQNLTFIYIRYDSPTKEVVCNTNSTFISDHFNATLQQLEVRIKPDWDYYKKGASK